MSDFDFDELDKAVAGVTNSPADVSSSSVSEPAERAPLDTPAPSFEKSEPAKNVPAARRGSGRFMDVVHPSSDMRSRSTPAFVSPSPLAAEPTVTSAPAESKEKEADQFEEINAEEWSKPLETPFLPDAKVEKRPLGGFGPEPKLALLEEPEEELKLEAPDELRLEETTLPDPIDFAAHVASLSSEKEDTGALDAQDVKEERVEEQTVEQLEDLKEPEPSTPPVLEVKTSSEPVGPTSITQQYTEQPSLEQESGAIYDTENYHQPLAPVAKKHSSVLTVLGILGLVILGAGAGVAFYFFVLPTL